MKGLDLAEAYYREIGAPVIFEQFEKYTDRIAIGLVGPGSECFGYDDTLSRDHDWGPAFCIWLSGKDFERIGRSLQAAYEKLPQTFRGYGPRIPSPGEAARTGVSRIVSFYKTYTGQNQIPPSNRHWLAIPEHALAVCTNGRVFHDPCGDFSNWRKALLDFYPDDVRLKKIASRCITIAQYGQYNFERCLKRGEYFTGHYAMTKFCHDVISMVFLLNRRYTPFYKWMHKAVARLPVLGRKIHDIIDGLTQEHGDHDRSALIEELCSLLVDALRRENLTSSQSLFLLDHAHQVHAKIEDPELGARLVAVD